MTKETHSALETGDFKDWFASVKAEAESRDVAWLITEPVDHLEGYLDGCTPAEEVTEQIGAAQSLA